MLSNTHGEKTQLLLLDLLLSLRLGRGLLVFATLLPLTCVRT